jgi:pilus assembly protein CpaB
MNRRNRTLAVLFVALIVAGAATWAMFRAVSRIPVRQVEVASMYVAVATENLPNGTRLTKDHIKVVGWPSSSPVPGSFKSADEIVNRGLIQSVVANEPLTESKLAPIEAGAGLPPSIPPGMRAVSIRVNDVIGVAGFTVPGTRVDVLVTLRDKDESMTRAVLSNIQVLTAGTMIDQDKAKDGQPIRSAVVTLLVTPDDAEKITLAQNAGGITLVLRNPLDVLPTETKGARMASLRGAPDAPPVVKSVDGQRRVVRAAPKPAAEVPVPSPTYRIETIKAGKATTDEVIK